MPEVDLHDPAMPMMMSLDQPTKAERWHSGQDKLDVKHVVCSSNKQLFKDYY
jgi:hypothetical protein